MLCLIKNEDYDRVLEVSSDIDTFNYTYKIFMNDFYIYDSDNCGEEEILFIFLKDDKTRIIYKLTHEWWWEGDGVYKDRELINEHYISEIEEVDLDFAVTEYINNLLIKKLNKA